MTPYMKVVEFCTPHVKGPQNFVTPQIFRASPPPVTNAHPLAGVEINFFFFSSCPWATTAFSKVAKGLRKVAQFPPHKNFGLLVKSDTDIYNVGIIHEQ